MEPICVGAVLVRRGGALRVLLGERSATRAYYPGVWDVPGGHCEPDEQPEQALVRELDEELGVRPTAWRPLADLRGAVGDHHASLVLHLYEVVAWQGTPRNRLPEEHARIAWFTIEEACRLRLAHPAYPALLRRLASSG